MQKLIVPIRGMHCKSCEILIEENIKQIPGVKKVESSHVSGRAKIWFEENKPSQNAIGKAVEAAGYTVGQDDKKHWFSRNPRDYYYLVNAAAILFFLFIAFQMFGLSDIAGNLTSKSIAMAGVIGLVAGISSCMALIGGLVLALSARHSESHPEATPVQKFRPHLFFNLGRVLGFALFGGLIGLIGSALQPSPRFLGILTLLVGGVMILLGLKLVEVFPILQRVNLTLPKFVSRLLGIKHEAKEYSHKSAFLGGALTFFLPCGFTQAMQLYAVSTGNFVQGALIMSLFALGTAPGLLSIGGLSSAFKGSKARLFFATAGLAVILLGVFNVSNASRIVFPGSPETANTAQTSDNAITGTVQEVRMTQGGSGYSPNQFTVKKGNTVRWIINSTNQYTCASYINMPAYKISRPLKAGENIIEFTPMKTGEIAFSCSMGMYRGKFTVVD
ncbi:MAG: sulfite exporter TauE/SafE family protein [Candidatus Doudnabacteria bacterium]|nr:sulfite exporter TauE/SafE family protein [Candidatus Doudnabacteria bacterium]